MIKPIYFLCFLSIIAIEGFEKNLVEHVEQAVERAWKHESRLDKNMLQIYGMSSEKVRHLLNNLCCLENANYLEIGVLQGSTFIAAICNNKQLNSAVAVDNWSKFGGEKNQIAFLNNLNQYRLLLPENISILEKNSFSISPEELTQPIHIYFYDGDHSVNSQRKAFLHFNPIFAEEFIAVIDDWNSPRVRQGTKKAFQELGYTILKEFELPSSTNGDTKQWWNGFYVAVIRKNSHRMELKQ